MDYHEEYGFRIPDFETGFLVVNKKGMKIVNLGEEGIETLLEVESIFRGLDVIDFEIGQYSVMGVNKRKIYKSGVFNLWAYVYLDNPRNEFRLKGHAEKVINSQ